MQIKKDKAQARERGKTRHLRPSQRRLDDDPSTGTLDTPDASFRVGPESDVSESTELTTAAGPSSLSRAPRRLCTVRQKLVIGTGVVKERESRKQPPSSAGTPQAERAM